MPRAFDFTDFYSLRAARVTIYFPNFIFHSV